MSEETTSVAEEAEVKEELKSDQPVLAIIPCL